jgi:hypothetical protein
MQLSKEMSGESSLAQSMSQVFKISQERDPKTGQTCIYRDTPSDRTIGQKSGARDASTHRHRTHSAASGAPDLATCFARSKFNGRFSEHRTRPTLSIRCTPVSIQRRFSLIGCIRRWVNGRHYVRCTRGFEEAADAIRPSDATQCLASVRCHSVRRTDDHFVCARLCSEDTGR